MVDNSQPKARQIGDVRLTKPKLNFYRPISKPVMVNNHAKGPTSKPKEQGEASTSQAGKSGVNSPPKKDVDNVPLKNTFDALKDTYASNDVGSIMDDSDTEEVENVFVEDNGTPMDNLVDDARKKVEAPPKKTHRKTGNLVSKMETKDTLSLCSNSEEQQMQQIQDKAKKSCMVSFRQLHSHLKLLSNNDLKGTRTESGFKRAFATLFGQDIETFTGTMFLYVDQLEKQLDKEEFQEIGSMASFKVLETQFQMFIKSRMYMDDEYVVMTRNYFLQYTQLEIPEFRDTLIQHMESVKKSIDERALHKREYDIWVNERQMQTTEDKVDSSKALDASLVDTESSGTTLKEQDNNNRSGYESHADDADIRPIYDEELMAEFAKSSILGKPALQPRRNQSVVRQPTAFKSERPRISKQQFASQVDVNNDLSKPVTTHYLPKERESAVAKPHHMIAPGSSRSYALSWKPCQGDSLNLPDHRIHKDGDGDALFQLKSDSLPHAHAQTTKTYYKHQDSRIMKAQELKTKTSAQTLIYKIFLQRYQVYQGRLLASF
ncbi:hypothetical protein Tco_0093642 [Tanacetum coccineum]